MRELIELTEDKQTLELKKLPYAEGGLAPVMSRTTIQNHYGKLAKGYVDRYNKGEGDASFNEAGAYLHNIFFPQLRAPKNGNSPSGASLALINKHFD
jgi:superoxide dismutase